MSHTRRFFSDFAGGQEHIFLQGEEFYHLKKVLRAKVSDPVEVINGRGILAFGRISDLRGHRAAIRVESMEQQPEPPVNLIMAPSLLKNRTMNEMIEKLSEIGVDEIHPVIFNRTDTRSNHSKSEKWNKIATQALKVNKRLWKTSVTEAVHIDEILALSKGVSTRILMDIQANPSPDLNWTPPGLVVIGPPGDITDTERQLFLKNGFSAVNINDSTLKTETAALSIAAIVKNLERGSPRQND